MTGKKLYSLICIGFIGVFMVGLSLFTNGCQQCVDKTGATCTPMRTAQISPTGAGAAAFLLGTPKRGSGLVVSGQPYEADLK